jgi:hypothetical protein
MDDYIGETDRYNQWMQLDHFLCGVKGEFIISAL